MKTQFIKAAGRFLSKNSPKLLTVTAIAGIGTTIYLCIKATANAVELVKERKAELEVDKLTLKETIRVVGKSYVPTTISALATAALMMGATTVNSKRIAALMTAANMSEMAFQEYKSFVKETNPELHKETTDKIVEKHLMETPYVKENVFKTGHGDQLCYDGFAGRYFLSDTDFVKNAVNEFNSRLIHEMALSLNDFYDHQDIEHSRVGDMLGWNIYSGIVGVDYSSKLTDTGKPVFVINFYDTPYAGFINGL